MTDTSGFPVRNDPFRMMTPPRPPSQTNAANAEGNDAVSSTDKDKETAKSSAADIRDAARRWQAMAVRILIGGATDDVLESGANSWADAGGGNDTVDVSTNSKVLAGDGNDSVRAWSGSDVDGGAGDDLLEVWSDSRVDGGAGNDTIRAWSNTEVFGGEGDDAIDAWSESRVEGGAGNDNIYAWSNSYVSGGDGDDFISAHSGSVVSGGRGNDAIYLGPNATATFALGDGKDTLRTSVGATLEFGPGFSAEKMDVTYGENGYSFVLSFEGNETDQIYVHGSSPFTVTFADGTTQTIVPRYGNNNSTDLHSLGSVTLAYSEN